MCRNYFNQRISGFSWSSLGFKNQFYSGLNTKNVTWIKYHFVCSSAPPCVRTSHRCCDLSPEFTNMDHLPLISTWAVKKHIRDIVLNSNRRETKLLLQFETSASRQHEIKETAWCVSQSRGFANNNTFYYKERVQCCRRVCGPAGGEKVRLSWRRGRKREPESENICKTQI